MLFSSSVLYRDINEDLSPYFHKLFGVLCSIVDKVAISGGVLEHEEAPNPELTGKLFETMSHVLRYVMTCNIYSVLNFAFLGFYKSEFDLFNRKTR